MESCVHSLWWRTLITSTPGQRGRRPGICEEILPSFLTSQLPVHTVGLQFPQVPTMGEPQTSYAPPTDRLALREQRPAILLCKTATEFLSHVSSPFNLSCFPQCA
ncbi:hypothetical protein L798_10305 [Zootermopsis nevadensis]|uniref:Uncharacterized protein n=1 Tax=Zootermopsis nevadensis TaxID=136037 RepID=A0A067QZB3_ZOONE|nr:hypothetical protein L798_10305 [Zootermopsis nevadensis]